MLTSAAHGARFQSASDQSLLVYFGQRITLDAHQHVVRLLRLLELEPVAGIRNLHPAYCSLLIKFDALKLRHVELEAILRSYLDRLEDVHLPGPRQLEIPVCYGGEYGPDRDAVRAMHGWTLTRSIEVPALAPFLVLFLGV